MWSQWVFKRVCKFFVKRLLGRLLRSEVDLDQLDVQLGLGTIVLKDLHLNTDYLNDQLGYAAVAIKEGIVGSVKARIPLRVLTDESCMIELEDLKLVVIPRPSSQNGADDSLAASGIEAVRFVDSQDYLGGDGDGYCQSAGGGGAYLGVDDGVRMIAQMVERILLNLRVKVTNLVIVFEEQNLASGNGTCEHEQDRRKSSHRSSVFHSILVVRVPRLEYGVETAPPEVDDTGKGSNEVEPNMLVKVVKFEGATVEVADVLKVKVSRDVEEESITMDHSQPSFLRKPVKILDGDLDGITGTIQLSVPWKDGTVDVPKFHADIMIGTVKLKASPHEIRQLFSLVQVFTAVGETDMDKGNSFPFVSPSTQGAVSVGDLSKTRGYVAASIDRSRDIYRSFAEPFPINGGQVSEAAPPNSSLLPFTKFISWNWMYSGASEGQRKDVEVRDADLAASVDEFFECFDGTRSIQQSQASGLWSWPRSAFSAITAASSLATGSTIIPPDNFKQVEYSIKAKLAGVSFQLYYDFFHPEDTSEPRSASSLGGSFEEHLDAILSDIQFVATVSPNQVDCTTTIKTLEISEVEQLGESLKTTGTQSWQDDRESYLNHTRSLQASIETALPPFPATLGSSSVGGTTSSCEKGTSDDWKAGRQSVGGSQQQVEKNVLPGNLERKRLVAIHTGPEYGARVTLTLESTSKTSFSLTEVHCFLQPLVFWLDLRTLKRIESLLRRYEESAASCERTAALDLNIQDMTGPRDGTDGGCREGVSYQPQSAANEDTHAVPRMSCPLNVYLSSIRVIVCFPADTRSLCSVIQEDFIGLDLRGPPLNNGVIQPMLVYKHVEEKHMTVTGGAGFSVLLRFEDIAANLISTDISPSERPMPGDITPFSVKEISTVFYNDPIWGALPTLDRPPDQGISVEIQWFYAGKDGNRLAKKTWDGIAAQQIQADGGRGIGGSNSEYAAATTAAEVVEEQNSQLRKELISSSSLVVRVQFPQVQLHLAEPHYTRVLELLKRFTESLVGDSEEKSSGESRNLANTTERHTDLQTVNRPQICVLLQCGKVDVDMCLPPQSLGLTSIHCPKPWEVINFDIEKLQVLCVTGIEGVSEISYLWVHHEEGQVTGSYREDSTMGADEKSEVLLLSCRNKALGRGDGGGGNALAAGTSGLSLTYMVWPDQEPADELLGSAIFTGTIRGCTFVAHGGRLDWLLAVSSFLNPAENNQDLEDACTDSLSAGTAEYKSTDDQSVSSSTSHLFFLLDFQDAALCYEPGSEAMIGPGLRAEIDPLRRGAGSSLESSQMHAPVACVLAAAALRVSSSAVPQAKGEQFDIWLRDVALHLLDTTLRKHLTSDYTTASMKRTGYVQIAKEAVMEALVRINCEDGRQWEVECANSQLHFETCHDTTAAFGRLVAQLQQLFAPEIDPTSVNLHNNNIDRRGSSSGSPSTRTIRIGASGEMDNSVNENFSEINLFEGVLEDAFSRVKSSPSSVAGGDDQLSSGAYSLLHSRVGSMDRNDSIDRRQDAYEPKRSSPSTPTSENQQDVLEEPPVLNNAGPPKFIEDYYITLQKQGSLLGDGFSKQSGESPRPSGGPSRGSSSSGGGREVEGRGGWYAGKVLKVLENHVSEGRPSSDADQQGAFIREHPSKEGQTPNKAPSLPKKYPNSVGRVLLSDLKAKWRLYGGSDWPTGRTYDKDSMYHSGIEENGRQSNVCLEVLLNEMRVQYDTFPAVGLYASRLVVTVRDIAVYDESNDAPWKTVVSYNRSKGRPRESSAQAVIIEMDAVRPDPTAPLEEYRLLISLLPISLHLDQRHIDFCIQFFSQHRSGTTDVTPRDEAVHPLSDSTSNLASDVSSDINEMTDEELLPFFQICEMRPLTIRVDYVPRRVDISSLGKGNYAELLNFVSWKGIELNLKHVKATGVHGWSSLSGVMVGEWLEDISQNQVHKFVKGAAPIRPFYAMGSGAAKLVALPVEHYKKDRRLLLGMRKGAMAFFRSISVEVLGLGAHLAAGAHEFLQQTELAVGGTLSPCTFTAENGERRSKAVQPGDTREGIQQARESISRGLERTASSLVGNPYKLYQRGGAGPAVASALRAAPAAAVAPASAAAGAVHRLVLGLRNELDPEKKRESDEKHSGPPPDTGRVR
ncbi:autophagy-related protein 2 [Marchantia polymorpha subsp. ruderalis]|uniref:Autophagy-related protein 2 n=2 Tax=Marchantia polymorpha TaxID=3197 RepID=A0AAF6BTG5_MARPO|nr:hypothetical protein MARPO_0038s0067 [Marchantia polymorpha]PTQ40734.1 hypothetical protein MARPO_0038s0067 [Marchantia polymorpha]BBN15299.1 hypothetical protein Mp_6g18570 [Marchantia polymorpha subsp. ruderalis]BBN15300.1 hypothetical protein Mp_6g18570 [Marchantia polymorpha subsp. ruderalis]|eukprot:PTQ40732.1 hypothetical protein MARPO_0038s0067 [Marchantia polymorpha]